MFLKPFLKEHLQKRLEAFGRLVRGAGLGVARVQVHDRGTRLGGPDRGIGDLGRGDRQMGRHRGRMDRPRDRTCDDDLAPCHDDQPPPTPPDHPRGRQLA